MTGVKHRLRFSVEDDLRLLHEVLRQNPYIDSAKWTIIRNNIHQVTGKNFSVRSVKEHVNLLLQIWLRKGKANKKKLGVEEAVYTEKDTLLQNIFNISKKQQTSYLNKTVTAEKKNSIEEGNEASDSWVITTQKNIENGNINSFTHVLDNNYTDHSSASTSDRIISSSSYEPFTSQKEDAVTTDTLLQITTTVPVPETETATLTSVKVNSPTALTPPNMIGPITTQMTGEFKKSVLDYLRQKNEREFEIRSRELDLQERRITLEERKLKLDEEKLTLELYERKKRLDLEEEKLKMELVERQQMKQIMESQQKMIETFLKTIEKKE